MKVLVLLIINQRPKCLNASTMASTNYNYHQLLLVTLFGPRNNETVLGQMNLTPITMALEGGGGVEGPVASDPATAPEGGGGGGQGGGSTYDSRGAAYYVCIVIVVYAFAIVSFVLSVARRRRGGGGRHDDAKYRLPGGDDVIDDGRTKKRRRRTGVCWSRVRGAEDIVGWTQWSSTSEEEEEGSSQQGVTVIKGEDCAIKSLGVGEVDVQRDEFITLVQILPSLCSETGNCSVVVESLERTAREEGQNRFSDLDVDHRESEPRCCWSMGPDGNIWIIQVHEEHRRSPAQTGDAATDQSKSSFSANQNACPSQREDLIALTLSLQGSAYRGSDFDQLGPSSEEERQRRNSGDTVEDCATTTTDDNNHNAREAIGTCLHWSAPLANVHATTLEQSRVTIRKQNYPKDSDDFTLVCMPKITSPGFVSRLIHVTSV